MLEGFGRIPFLRGLPESVVLSNSVNGFMNALDKHFEQYSRIFILFFSIGSLMGISCLSRILFFYYKLTKHFNEAASLYDPMREL